MDDITIEDIIRGSNCKNISVTKASEYPFLGSCDIYLGEACVLSHCENEGGDPEDMTDVSKDQSELGRINKIKFACSKKGGAFNMQYAEAFNHLKTCKLKKGVSKIQNLISDISRKKVRILASLF